MITIALKQQATVITFLVFTEINGVYYSWLQVTVEVRGHLTAAGMYSVSWLRTFHPGGPHRALRLSGVVVVDGQPL